MEPQKTLNSKSKPKGENKTKQNKMKQNKKQTNEKTKLEVSHALILN